MHSKSEIISYWFISSNRFFPIFGQTRADKRISATKSLALLVEKRNITQSANGIFGQCVLTKMTFSFEA